MNYAKYHALGNDYIVLNPEDFPLPLTPARIRLLCDRHFGVGSDGILFGPVDVNGGKGLRIYNPDGGEAEKSGNGIRIFARYLLDRGLSPGGPFVLETVGGRVAVEYLDGAGENIRVGMGSASFESARIPVAGAPRRVVDEEAVFAGKPYRITCVTVGNPHCVIPVPHATPALAKALGPVVENAPMFPNRINLQLLEAIDRSNIRIEIWERGAGYTLASGSSSCAAACAAHRLGLVGDSVSVHMPGGVIRVDIAPDGEIRMTGAVCAVCAGALAPQFEHELSCLQ